MADRRRRSGDDEPQGSAAAILRAVDGAVEQRWEAAKRRAESVEGPTEQRVTELTRLITREVTAVGALTGGAAAVPGVGTATALGTTAADFAFFTARAGDLILSIAAVHGHTDATVEERRMWVLAVLTFGPSAGTKVAALTRETGFGAGNTVTSRIPGELWRRVNRSIAKRIVTKYGTRRGVVALGRALPFGFGAAIGGGGNYLLIRSIARQADTFFREGTGGTLRFEKPT